MLALFFASGIAVSSVAARFQAIRDLLDAKPSAMGLLVLSSALGSILTMPLAGTLLSYIPKKVFVRLCAVLALAGMAAVAGSAMAHYFPGALVATFVMGMGIGPWDVAMNLAGTSVERALGRSIMPRFHAGFSLGTVFGALVGALLARLGLVLAIHLVGMGLVALGLVWWGSSRLLPDAEPAVNQPASAGIGPSRARLALAAWAEPRTLLIGVVVLVAGLTEGSANDWLVLGIGQDFSVDESVGIVGLALFLMAMTVMRLLGTSLVDRYGRVVVQRLSTALALAGLVAFGLGPNLGWVMVGAAAWGFGSGMGFPLGLSAAADDPLRAAARTSVVTSIGYTAFLGGPAFLGWLAGHLGYRQALLVIILPAVLAFLLAPLLREQAPANTAEVS